VQYSKIRRSEKLEVAESDFYTDFSVNSAGFFDEQHQFFRNQTRLILPNFNDFQKKPVTFLNPVTTAATTASALRLQRK
jgi:hypothetical protein